MIEELPYTKTASASKEEIELHWSSFIDMMTQGTEANKVYNATLKVPTIAKDKVYRIWDNKNNKWHSSNTRSIWLSLSGCKTALGHANKSQWPKHTYDSNRYQIKTFNLEEI